MKSTIIEEAGAQKQKDEYPCLKRWPDGYTVLFTAPSTGTVVSLGSFAISELGRYSKTWEEDNTKPLPPGTIVQLQNN